MATFCFPVYLSISASVVSSQLPPHQQSWISFCLRGVHVLGFCGCLILIHGYTAYKVALLNGSSWSVLIPDLIGSVDK